METRFEKGNIEQIQDLKDSKREGFVNAKNGLFIFKDGEIIRTSEKYIKDENELNFKVFMWLGGVPR